MCCNNIIIIINLFSLGIVSKLICIFGCEHVHCTCFYKKILPVNQCTIIFITNTLLLSCDIIAAYKSIVAKTGMHLPRHYSTTYFVRLIRNSYLMLFDGRVR